MQKKKRWWLSVCLSGWLSACSYHTRVVQSDAPPLAAVPVASAPSASVVLDDLQATFNGKTATVRSSLSERFASELRRSGLFRTVYVPATAKDAPPQAAHMTVHITEVFDPHWSAKVGKDALVGASMMVLAPITHLSVILRLDLRIIAAQISSRSSSRTGRKHGPAHDDFGTDR